MKRVVGRRRTSSRAITLYRVNEIEETLPCRIREIKNKQRGIEIDTKLEKSPVENFLTRQRASFPGSFFPDDRRLDAVRDRS